ncbi:MAG: host-nuclease inhibitor Gam family protein [Leptospiraceae bacterium]|nr:host-nuclease inhibitor Gam family protein [Leptospiraceae bacterium]MCK6380865.1 host-nuclease inhibitor Gam family protein [Leptospiraceae bacterium]
MKQTQTRPLETLEDLNNRMSRLVEIESELKKIDGEKNKKVEMARNEFVELERDLVFEREELDQMVREFLLQNKDTIFASKKTVELPFATVKRIDSQEIEVRDEKSKELPPYTIELIEKNFPDRADEAIKIEKKVQKNTLKNWTDSELAKIGATRFYNTNINYKLRLELEKTDIAKPV